LNFLPEPQGQASLRPTLPQVVGSFGLRSAGAETLARHGIGGVSTASAQAAPRAAPAPAERNPKDPTTWGKVGRNEACPCGSGKKFKHCHGRYA